MDRTTQIGIGIGVFVFVILMIFMFVPMGDCQTDENKYSQFEGGGSTWLKSCKSCPGLSDLSDCRDLKHWQVSSCGMSCKARVAASEFADSAEEIVGAASDSVGSTGCTAAIAAASIERCCDRTTTQGECNPCSGGRSCMGLCVAVDAACGY